MQDKYELKAEMWFRESTDEWVVELSGGIDDTHMTCRHTQPSYIPPSEVPGLPTLYPEGWIYIDPEEGFKFSMTCPDDNARDVQEATYEVLKSELLLAHEVIRAKDDEIQKLTALLAAKV